MTQTMFYQGIGPTLTRHDIDVDAATLTKRESVTIPGANVQYVWPHPSKQWLYVVASNGGPGIIPGTTHIAMAFRIDPASGALTPHGNAVPLPSRPVHCSVDRAGRHLLTAYVKPSTATVHRIEEDGTLGAPVPPREPLDGGVFAHQILTTPSDRTAIMVTRGNNAAPGKSEDPGALKVYRYDDGVLSNIASIQRGNGLGFGPRHFDIHPNNEWLFLSVERQSELHVYKLNADGTLPRDAMFVANALIDRASYGPTQMSGAIHIHPNGRFVYMTNRNSGTEQVGGRKVFKGGENNIAVFSIDAATGAPALIQHVEAHTNHLRTFAIDPTGRLLIAASIEAMPMRDGTVLPAALVLYRIGSDGKLSLARKYDVDTGHALQFWTGMMTLS